VVFTSDNGSLGEQASPWGGDREPGGGSNAPLRGAKATSFEGGFRVPGIVRWPSRIAPGRVCDELVTSMDLLPTIAAVCGAALPSDRVIDGRDVSAIWFDESAGSPHDAFWYYRANDLEAVRVGSWKLHVARKGDEVCELYDLSADVAESIDRSAERPDLVAELLAHAERARASLGDARLGRAGTDLRVAGRVEDPKPLTSYDPDHPYYLAEYDLTDKG
jgi:arylsulfatase A-like enzyme